MFCASTFSNKSLKKSDKVLSSQKYLMN